jgi:tRNA threonylcarbamoyladenosine biosynthesis protein TsaE
VGTEARPDKEPNPTRQMDDQKNQLTGVFTTNSPEETFTLAEQIARTIIAPTVFLLIGDLGAGKTVFAKGLAAGLGIDPDEVTSPSFTLVNQYEGRLKFYHLDLYRLDDARAVYDHLGLDEMLTDRAVVVIEWAEKLGVVAGDSAYKVEMTWLDDTTRRVKIERVID